MSLFLSVCEFCHNHGAKGVCCWGLSLKRVLERRVWCVYHITMWCHRTPLSKIHMGLVRWNIKSPKLSLGWSLCHQFYPSIHLVIKCHSSWINFTLDCHVKMKYSYKQNINKILGRDYLFSSINKAELIVYMSEEQQKQSIVLQSKQQKIKNIASICVTILCIYDQKENHFGKLWVHVYLHNIAITAQNLATCDKSVRPIVIFRHFYQWLQHEALNKTK